MGLEKNAWPRLSHETFDRKPTEHASSPASVARALKNNEG